MYIRYPLSLRQVEVILAKTGDRHGNPVLVLARRDDVVGRITRRLAGVGSTVENRSMRSKPTVERVNGDKSNVRIATSSLGKRYGWLGPTTMVWPCRARYPVFVESRPEFGIGTGSHISNDSGVLRARMVNGRRIWKYQKNKLYYIHRGRTHTVGPSVNGAERTDAGGHDR